MIVTVAVRSLLSRPVRSAVLAGGFGIGVAVMAALLGIGGVILEQARAPELAGGGDVVIGGASGRVSNAQFVLFRILASGPLADRVAAAAPTRRASLYLLDANGPVAVEARGGIPSLDRAMRDPEIRDIPAWTDTAADRAWATPGYEDVLRAMDRFHAIPHVPARASSWAEWLYFNGHASSSRFYLTFFAGPEQPSGKRPLGVRLQLDVDGSLTSYSDSFDVDAGALAAAPDLTAGGSRVRLVGHEYRITLDLPSESGGPRATGELAIGARPGQALPPFEVRGAGGWVSGYVVPVIAGTLSGALQVGSRRIDFSGGAGYHDHNWGFWEGVHWQWGQVQGDGLSFVYGRVFPPADAADAGRAPAFLVALGPDGPAGYATDVAIEEIDGIAVPGSSATAPRRIIVRARGDALDLTLDLSIEHATATRMRQGSFGRGMNFLQLRGRYRVSGRVGEQTIALTARGSAETFGGE